MGSDFYARRSARADGIHSQIKGVKPNSTQVASRAHAARLAQAANPPNAPSRRTYSTPNIGSQRKLYIGF
jgi:hypothetical protein